jgi:DNA-binding MarR family transcriptional regulator
MKTENKKSEGALDTAVTLHQSASRLTRVLRASFSTERLSASKLGVLGFLHREGPATAADLAAYLRVQPQSLTRLVDDLEGRSLIDRLPSMEDRRRSPLKINEAGLRLLTETIGKQRESLARTIAEVLTPAEQELLRLSAGLMDELAAALEGSVLAQDSPEKSDGH